MARRVRIVIGDVFQVPLGNGKLGRFQYVSDDATMLDSSVIQVFAKIWDYCEQPRIDDTVMGAVGFNAHVFIGAGLKFYDWKKIGNAPIPKKIDVIFRESEDYGSPEIKVSRRWKVWRINEATKYVGKLPAKYQEAEIGIVVAPEDIAERICTGSYGFTYPRFES